MLRCNLELVEGWLSAIDWPIRSISRHASKSARLASGRCPNTAARTAKPLARCFSCV